MFMLYINGKLTKNLTTLTKQVCPWKRTINCLKKSSDKWDYLHYKLKWSLLIVFRSNSYKIHFSNLKVHVLYKHKITLDLI